VALSELDNLPLAKVCITDPPYNVPTKGHIRVTRVNDLIRVVTLDAAVMASGSLTYLVGCGVTSYGSDQVCLL